MIQLFKWVLICIINLINILIYIYKCIYKDLYQYVKVKLYNSTELSIS